MNDDFGCKNNNSQISGIFFGKYKILEKIGFGSFGQVYSAQNIQTKAKYAVKFVNKKKF